MVVHKNFIRGEWVRSKSGKTFESDDPASGKILGTFQSSNRKDVEDTVKAARAAFPKWRDTPPPKRASVLWKATELLKNNKELLAQIVTKEMGKVIAEGRGDVQEAIDMFELMAGEGRRLYGHTTTSELPNKAAFTIRRPVGVMALITPWNFPFAIPSWKTAPALIGGNTVIFKPSSDIPLAAVEFTKILESAGVPAGVFNMVTGSASDIGEPLVESREIDGVSFTGSRETGEWILKNAGLKKVGLELGGKNAIIIMDDADLGLALDGVLFGAFGTTGQRCTATSRVILHKKVKAKFEKMLLDALKKLKVGDGMRSDVGPLINEKAVYKSEKYVEIGKKEGAKLLTGGKRMKGKGNFFEPTVFTNCKGNMRICQEEIFGPVLSLIEVKDIDEALEVANDVDYGLSSAIYTEDFKNAFALINKGETGLTYVNSSTIGSEVHLPFGGVKGTGNGTREGGIHGIEEFTEVKTVYIDYSGKLQKAQIDTGD